MSNTKRVFIIRHAKTEQDMDFDKKDFDRILTARGKKDALNAAIRLQEKEIEPCLMIASTAYRAASTAAIIAAQLDYNASYIQWESDLYLCEAETIDAQIQSVKDDSIDTLFIIAHNMGVTEYINHKVAQFQIDNVPTAGIIGFELNIDSWSQNNMKLRGQLIYSDYPSKHK